MEVKAGKRKAVATVLLIGILLIAIVLMGGESSPFGDMPVNSAEDAAALLHDLGWQADPTQAQIQESVLPTEFDDVFNEYNAMQLEQGCDLSKYAGKPITVYTLPIVNYPNYSDTVLATVIVYNSTVIGGDIHAAKLDGFMHGLK